MPAARVSWTCAIFLLGYVGIEVALGGWIVLFMLEVRNGDEFSSGMSAMGFWLGITVGRLILGFVTARVGIKLATSVSHFTLFRSLDIRLIL
jgi:fucose permease